MRTEEHFIYGLEYTVRHSFSKTNDPESLFIVNTEWVYVTRTDIWRDKAELAYIEFDFYNMISNYWGSLRCEEEKDLQFVRQKFDVTGGWPHPGEVETTKVAIPEVTADTQKLPASFIPYFKSILEGCDNVENWFYWLDRNNDQLKRVMNTMELLRLRTDSFTEIKRIVEENDIPFQLSPRYQWLSKKRKCGSFPVQIR